MSDVREITQAWKAANAFLREKDEALRQLDALRKRNEKLERVAALARKLPGRRVGQTPYIVLLNEILVALSDLDKERLT